MAVIVFLWSFLFKKVPLYLLKHLTASIMSFSLSIGMCAGSIFYYLFWRTTYHVYQIIRYVTESLCAIEAKMQFCTELMDMYDNQSYLTPKKRNLVIVIFPISDYFEAYYYDDNRGGNLLNETFLQVVHYDPVAASKKLQDMFTIKNRHTLAITSGPQEEKVKETDHAAVECQPNSTEELMDWSSTSTGNAASINLENVSVKPTHPRKSEEIF